MHQPERSAPPEVVEQLRALDAGRDGGGGLWADHPATDSGNAAEQGIINVHASLLPKYRGAAPIQWAIARGETRTGVTTMRINEGLDTGDMLLQSETDDRTGRERCRTRRAAGFGRSGVAGADAGRTSGDYGRKRKTTRRRRMRRF